MEYRKSDDRDGREPLAATASLAREKTGEISIDLVANAARWYEGNLAMVFENIEYANVYLTNRKAFLDTYFRQ